MNGDRIRLMGKNKCYFCIWFPPPKVQKNMRYFKICVFTFSNKTSTKNQTSNPSLLLPGKWNKRGYWIRRRRIQWKKNVKFKKFRKNAIWALGYFFRRYLRIFLRQPDFSQLPTFLPASLLDLSIFQPGNHHHNFVIAMSL